MKTALVTGASRGIGAACARGLAEAGCRVFINYQSDADAAGALAGALGGIAVQADVADSAQVKQLFEKVGTADILVCNAGKALCGLLSETPEDAWQRVVDVNLGGVIRCCQAAIPAMVRQKSGRIILISSIWGTVGASCEAVYSATKAGLFGLTKSLAKELGPSGITVNCVAPGVIKTDMNNDLTPEVLDELATMTPLGMLGKPEDVAALVRFLASDAAQFITGQIIGVDGGFTG
ncbi:3-oxoacyl-ACP reductase FabG [Oscillospiraceae bacterium CM]|nr:3-oxoacyl-ACP reductase FabG [Oscillospiraceae bacterium CM]